MNMAFNASLQCANAALLASGYRAASQTGHHERIINSLRYTIRLSGEIINQLNKFRNKRIKAAYDLAGVISDYEVDEAIKLARHILKSVNEWLAKYHPEFVK